MHYIETRDKQTYKDTIYIILIDYKIILTDFSLFLAINANAILTQPLLSWDCHAMLTYPGLRLWPESTAPVTPAMMAAAPITTAEITMGRLRHWVWSTTTPARGGPAIQSYYCTTVYYLYYLWYICQVRYKPDEADNLFSYRPSRAARPLRAETPEKAAERLSRPSMSTSTGLAQPTTTPGVTRLHISY